jgi:hypothetical protein
MKKLIMAYGSAEPDWQRRDIRSLHGLRVPPTPIRETSTTGLTTAIPGINDVSAYPQANTVERPM